MYSLNYSAKDGWTLWADSNLGPIILMNGTFKDCWNILMSKELRKKGVYKPYVY